MDTLRPVVICSDARRIPLADGSVHCVVTSPPYWGLRAYGGDPGMIGLEPTFDDHLANLVDVFREVRRVLRDDGTLWLNYGDAYAAAGSGGGHWNGAKQDSNSGTVHRKGPTLGFKPKDLMMMPARVAMALQADGWWLRSEIVWHKPNPMPESCTDRPTSSHEKVFLLTKKPRYFYDADAVREPQAQGTIDRFGNGGAPMVAPKKEGGSARKTKQFFESTPEAIMPDGKANLRNVWKISTHSFSGAHFATFPPALAKRCILAGTSAAGVCAGCGAPWGRQVEKALETDRKLSNPEDYEGYDSNNQGSNRVKDGHLRGTYEAKTTGWLPSCTCDAGRVPATVFDPFGGSGTVGICAEELGRRSVTLDINPEYCTMARERIDAQQPSLPLLG